MNHINVDPTGVQIDGAPVLDGFNLDLKELAASTRSSGDFWIFTCSCGVPACHGIERGVVVTHSGEQTRWLVPLPFRRSSPNSIRFREFTFDSRAYAAEVKAAVAAVREELVSYAGWIPLPGRVPERMPSRA